jgi:iron complex transport system permease protein
MGRPLLVLSPARLVSLLLVLVLVAILAMFAALCAGSVDIGAREVLAALSGSGNGMGAQVVLELRLPRVLAGFVVGGMLAFAGALMQVLLRNPLAEPYVLGVSGGAAAFALLAMLAGLGGVAVHAGAFGGALASILIVFALARGQGGWNPMRVLLTGVVVASGWGAVIIFLLSVSPAAQVHGMLFWLMGDLSGAAWAPWTAVVLAGALLAGIAMGRGLNLLAAGDLEALALGVPVPRLRHGVYFLASGLTALAVTQAGSIGFVGLIVPHLVRIVLGPDHRVLLPAATLAGGTLLVTADALARTLVAPQQLPVGILTAMLGVPLFLILLRTGSAREQP